MKSSPYLLYQGIDLVSKILLYLDFRIIVLLLLLFVVLKRVYPYTLQI